MKKTVLFFLFCMVVFFSCTPSILRTPPNPSSTPEEKHFQIQANAPLSVSILPSVVTVYRFHFRVLSEGLYAFETKGNVDSLCALTQQKNQKEKVLRVQESGGEKDNCRLVWNFLPGLYSFKVRVEGKKQFFAVLNTLSWDEVQKFPLHPQETHQGTLKNALSKHQYEFEVVSERIMQWKIEAKGHLQCFVRNKQTSFFYSAQRANGGCLVTKKLPKGKYFFELRSDLPNDAYTLFAKSIRLQSLGNRMILEGVLKKEEVDYYEIDLKANHKHLIQSFESDRIHCKLFKDLNQKSLPFEMTSLTGGCFFQGFVPAGRYFVRVGVDSTSSNATHAYSIRLKQSRFDKLEMDKKKAFVPPFHSSKQFFRFDVSKKGVYEVLVEDREVGCHLQSDSSQKLAQLRLERPQKRGCHLFVQLQKGAYFLEIVPETRLEKPYQIGIRSFVDTQSRWLSANRPRLFGSVQRGFEKEFQFKVSFPQVVVLETRGDLDTRCVLKQKELTLTQDDDSGQKNNCRIIRYLPKGQYSLSVRVSGRKTGLLWVQKSMPQTPFLQEGVELGWNIPVKNRPSVFLLRVEKPGMFSLETKGEPDTKCFLMDHEWNQIAMDDDSGYKRNCKVARFLGKGIYPFQVTIFRKPGDFSVFVRNVKTQLLYPENKKNIYLSSSHLEDFFHLRIPLDGYYILRTYGVLDTECSLMDSKGILIEKNDDIQASTDKNCQIIDYMKKGDYFLKIRLNSRRFMVRRLVTVHLAPKKIVAVPLKLGQKEEGELLTDEINEYHLVLSQKGYTQIETLGSSDTKCFLVDVHRKKMSENDDGGKGKNCKIARFLDAGTYYFQVRPALRKSLGKFQVLATQ